MIIIAFQELDYIYFQILTITRGDYTYNIKVDHSLAKLIFYSYGGYNLVLSNEFIKAISNHKQSIIDYSCRGHNNLYSTIIPILHNLEILKITDDHDTNYLKHTSFSNIEVVDVQLHYGQKNLLNLLDFIKINGNSIKILKLRGYILDWTCLGKFFQSIGQYCQNLESLIIIYNDELDQQLC